MKCPTQTGEMGGLTWNPTTAISGGKIVSKTRDSVLHVGFQGTTCPCSLVERGMGHPPIQCQTSGTQILEAFIPRNNPFFAGFANKIANSLSKRSRHLCLWSSLALAWSCHLQLHMAMEKFSTLVNPKTVGRCSCLNPKEIGPIGLKPYSHQSDQNDHNLQKQIANEPNHAENESCTLLKGLGPSCSMCPS